MWTALALLAVLACEGRVGGGARVRGAADGDACLGGACDACLGGGCGGDAACPGAGCGADGGARVDADVAHDARLGLDGGDAQVGPDAGDAQVGPDGGDAQAGPDAGAAVDAGAPSDAGVVPPPATCVPPVTPADVSQPTTVVTSCTEAALRGAVANGGVVVLRCGSAPSTITLQAEIAVARDTVIDGGGLVTLSGGGTTRILAIHSSFDRDTPRLTVQGLAFTRARTTDVVNTRSVEHGGAAIFRLGGSLTVIGCRFDDNHAPDTGQDVSGGAITSQGGGDDVIAGSTFTNNSASNGGAIGLLGSGLTLVNSAVVANRATGSGGNPGNGGNGGGIVMDGAGRALTICGSLIARNQGNALGGGLFRTSYRGEPTTIDRSLFDANTIPPASAPSQGGALYLQGTRAAITSSTLARNTCAFAAGIFAASHGAGAPGVIDLTNVTIAENRATGLAGAIATTEATGTLTNVTIARNRAQFAGAFAFAGGLRLVNSIVADNMRDETDPAGMFNANSCFCPSCTLADGGRNLQWPQRAISGRAEEPCAPGVTFADPMLGALADNGGPTPTILPSATGPAARLATGCPPTDQRGRPRAQAQCTAGAVELP